LTTYDAAGRVYQQVSAYGTTAQATDATYLYANDGQLAFFTDAEGNKTSYGFDGFDRRVATVYPNSDVELATLDDAGNVTAFTNRASQTIGMTYDALGRLTARDRPDGGSYIGDDYYSYDNLGRMKTASANPSSALITFTWDALGRLKQDSHSAFGAKYFDYDLAGRRIRMTWRDTFYVDYDYLVTGEMAAVRENGATSGVGVLATFGYDNLGNRTSLTRGNGTSTSYTPDAVSRLSVLTNSFPADPSKLLSLGFSYNAASQIVQNQRGNDLYSWTGHGSGNTVSTVDGLNRLTGVGSLTPGYDSNGNMTSDGTNAYTYASDNLLATGKGLNVIYDPLGRLMWVQNQGIVSDFTGTDLADELAVNTYAIQRRFVYGPGTDEPLVWYEGSGTTDRRWLHADERSSIVAISNASGIVTNVNTYDEYGRPGSGNVGRFQYTGQKWYAALGLYDHKARMYHPGLGRFMQTDPIGFGGGMNLYGYVGADPVNFADPLGLDSACSGTADITVCGHRNVTPGGFAGGGSVAGNSGGSSIDRPDGPQDVEEIVVTGVKPPPLELVAPKLSSGSVASPSLGYQALFDGSSPVKADQSKKNKKVLVCGIIPGICKRITYEQYCHDTRQRLAFIGIVAGGASAASGFKGAKNLPGAGTAARGIGYFQAIVAGEAAADLLDQYLYCEG
jgi:RHS repeat-associated protein